VSYIQAYKKKLHLICVRIFLICKFILIRKLFRTNRAINIKLTKSYLSKIDNFIQLNHDKYKPITNLENINYSKKIKKLSLQSSFHLFFSKNCMFFCDLVEYSTAKNIILKRSNISEKELLIYHLYPPNVLALDFIVQHLKKLKNFKVNILDIPAGIGNFLFYLSEYIDKSHLIGVDDFSQIDEIDIERYQKKTSKLKIYRNIPDKSYYFCVVIGLPFSLVVKDIIKLKPNFLIIESNYILLDENSLSKVYNLYELYIFNESISIFNLKNL
tara:strand:+ start:1449 stop:2261 length:813 start_codon:yes stop_codon:yes gene_type:complete